MKQRNPNWGCPRIAQQMALAFHIQIDKDVVRRILAHHYRPGQDLDGPSWLTFLGHMKDSLSLPKMLSGANTFGISDIQEYETEAVRTRRAECNNVTLLLNGSMEFLRTTAVLMELGACHECAGRSNCVFQANLRL
jgi:hypothetical protein